MATHQELEMLVGWFKKTLDPETPSQERSAAIACLEDAKQKMGVRGVQVGLTIAAASKPEDPVHYFGLLLTEHALIDLPSMHGAMRVELRKQLLAMVEHLHADGVPHRVQEKMAQLISDVARVEWPDQWESMVVDLLEVFHRGHLQALVVMRAFRTLIEEVVSTQSVAVHQPKRQSASRWDSKAHLPTDRKRALVTAIRSISEQLFDFLHKHLVQCLAALQNGDAPAPRTQAEVAISCLTALLELAPPSLIFTHRLPDSLWMALSLPQSSLWLSAAECLAELTTHSLFSPDNAKGFHDLVSGLCSIILSQATPLMGPIDVGDQGAIQMHQVLVALAASVGGLLRHNTPGLMWTDGSGQLVNLHPVLDACNTLLQVPSLLIANALLSPMKAVLTHDKVPPNIFPSLLETLRERLASTISNPMYEEEDEMSPFPSCTFSEISFDLEEEWNDFFEQLRREGRTLIIAYVHIARTNALETIVGWVKELVDSYSSPPPGDLRSSKGSIMLISRQAVAWESAEFIISSAMSYFSSHSVEQLQKLLAGELGSNLDTALDLLLGYHPTDPIIARFYVGVLCAFHPFFALKQGLLSQVLEKVFALLDFRCSFEAESSVLSPDTTEARAKVTKCFVRLCTTLPTHIMPLMTPLMSTISHYLSSGRLSDEQVRGMFEGIVSVSNHMGPADQSSLIQTISAPTVAEWVHEMGALAQPEALLHLLTNPEAPRKRYLQAANILVGIYRNARISRKDPSAPHALETLAPQILPPALQGCSTISSLWGAPQHLGGDYLAILDVSDAEKYHYIGAAGKEEWKSVPSPLEQQRQEVIEVAQSFLRDMREMLYELVGAVAGIVPVLHEHYDTTFRPSLLGHTRSMELRHLRPFLLHVAPPMIFACPQSSLPTMSQFIIGLARMCLDKVQTGYASAHAGEGENSIFMHKIASEVSNLLLDIPLRLSRTLTGGSEKSRAEAMARMHYLSDPKVVSALMMISSSLLRSPDNTVCARAVLVAGKLLPAVLSGADNQPSLYVLYGACLDRLLGAHLKRGDDASGVSGMLGCDSKEEETVQECISVVQTLLRAFHHTPQFPYLLHQAGLPEESVKQLIHELSTETVEGRRVSAMRAALVSQVIGRNTTLGRTPVSLNLLNFKPQPFPGECWFDPRNTSVMET